jgi:hypothetical protein
MLSLQSRYITWQYCFHIILHTPTALWICNKWKVWVLYAYEGKKIAILRINYDHLLLAVFIWIQKLSNPIKLHYLHHSSINSKHQVLWRNSFQCGTCLFTNTFYCSDWISSEEQIRMAVEGDTIPAFTHWEWENHKIFSQNCWSPGQSLNLRPPKYGGVLTTWVQHLVWCWIFAWVLF